MRKYSDIRISRTTSLVIVFFFALSSPAFAGDSTISPLDELIKNGATYVGSEDCESCHEKETREFRLSTHARTSTREGEIHGCEMCHGPASLHLEAEERKDKIATMINPTKNPDVCFSCHLEKKLELRRPYHHPVLEGKMSCSDCHSAHGMEAKPWSATSIKHVNEACFKCHKEQRGPFVYEHEALREGCTTCHQVHGSIHDKMLAVRDSNLCLTCHSQTNYPNVGGSGHASASAPRLNEGTCFNGGCHTAVHGSNFDDHLRY